MIIKKWNGSTFDEIYPKTTIADVYKADGTTSFLDGGKIREEYLPNSVFDSLKFYSALTANSNLSARAYEAITDASSNNRSPLGYYWVASNQLSLTANNTAVDAGGGIYIETRFKPGDGAAEVLSGADTLETGDWFLVSDIEGSGTSGDPYLVTFAVVDNTYEVATTSVNGIVKIGSATVQSTAANAVTSTASRTYATQFNSSGQLVVNVPWTDTNTTYTAGSGITLSGTEFSHSDTSSAANLTASGRTYVTGLTFDTFGHVTGYTTATETVVDTNTTYTAGTGLTLTGTEFTHTDTSSQASVNNSNGTVIQDVTLDGFGHVTALGSVDLDGRYFTETEITTTRKEFYVQASAPSPTQTDAIWFDI